MSVAIGRAVGRVLAAGDGLLHPLPLVAIALLLLNDQVLKRAAPGFVTGKLSDVAGLLFFPVFLVAVVEVCLSAIGRWRGPSRNLLFGAVVATGATFAIVKVLPVGESVYEIALGLGQWPFRAIAALAGGSSVPALAPVDLTRDPTDLIALAALAIPFAIGARRVAGEAADPIAPARGYDLVVGGLSVALLAGATMDGWAHSHELLALESVITPWHLVVYAAFAAVVVTLLGPPVTAWLGAGDRNARNVAAAAIPDGYGLSVAGVFVFAAMGVGDTLWHLIFGIESSAEALLSPTHLGLGLGAALIASGPIRRAWICDQHATWPRFLPAVLSVIAIAGVVAFALHVSNLFVDPWPRYPYALSDATWYGPYIGVASALVPAAILMVPTILLIDRWGRLPFGAVTLVFGGTLAGLTFLHDSSVLVGAPVLGGFVADVLLVLIRPGASRARLQLFGFLAPAGLFASYFVVLWATGTVAWSAHLIGGTIVLAGGVGWVVAAIVAPIVRSAR
jgi:GNAT superfamily N-acetyltransferase